MKVGLVIPPSLFLSDQRWFIHLGILRVAAVLEAKDIAVDVVDLSGLSNPEDALAEYLQIHSPTILGFTATSPQLPATATLASRVREVSSTIRTVLGGPHITLVNAAYRKERKNGTPGRATRAFDQLAGRFDVLVAGDGEEAIFKALSPTSQKLIDADDPSTPLFLTKERLTELPFPARHLVDVSSYHYQIDGVPALSMVAQLGCPFKCGFCGGRESPFLRRVRLRTTESVIAEMRHIYEQYGVRAIMFYDDELNVNPQIVQLMHAIARLGKELGIEWCLRGFVKAELLTKEQAEVMYVAGFREVLCGFESGSPRILRNIRKKATQNDNTRCVELVRGAGMRIKALMSVGHPGETEDTIRETQDWIRAIRPDSFDLTRITVYPGTPYFDHAITTDNEVWTYTIDGDRLYSREVDFFTNYTYYKGDRGDRLGHNRFFAFTDALSVDALAECRDRTERELREELGQPFQTDATELQFDHSMGMGLPDYILRSTQKT